MEVSDVLPTDLGVSSEEARACANTAYSERNKLVALLAALYPAGRKRTAIPGWEPEWHNCVYVDLPTGQASWHYHDGEAHLFAHLPEYTGEWDGHTTEQKYERIAALARAWTERRHHVVSQRSVGDED